MTQFVYDRDFAGKVCRIAVDDYKKWKAQQEKIKKLIEDGKSLEEVLEEISEQG